MGQGKQKREELIEYHIPATDPKGHSARHWFRTIPAMAREVEQIVQSKAFPYRTKGDLLRHALHRHISWLKKQKPIKSVTGQVDMILEVMRDEEMHSDFLLVFNKLDERINRHLRNGERKHADDVLYRVLEQIQEMPDGFWKDRYVEQIIKRMEANGHFGGM